MTHDARVFSTAAGELTNVAVKKKAQSAAMQATKFAADFAALASAPTTANQTKLRDEMTPVESAVEGIQSTCSSK